MAIKTAPAAMIQLAVFEDMNFNPSGGRGTGADKPRFPVNGYRRNIAGYRIKLQMTKVTSLADA